MRLSCNVPGALPMTTRSPEDASKGSWSSRVAALSGTRRQTNTTPAACQMASGSSSTRDTSAGETSASAVTVTTIGGGAAGWATAAADDAASAAAARLGMISILPAIDGRDHQKFDVRIRHERTPLNL